MADNVQVFVRARPRIAREADLPVLLDMEHQTTTLSPPPQSKNDKKPKQFQFDECLWSVDDNNNSNHHKSQEDCFRVCAHELISHTLNGFNTCIFAYGQTGSGKSYTMMGTQDQAGIIPRCCDDLFTRCMRMPAGFKVQLNVSYVEIYNEQVFDLLNDSSKLRVREDPRTGPYVEGMQQFTITTLEDFQKYISLGDTRRTVKSTKLNDQSSRSHAIFTITLRITEFDDQQRLISESNSSLKLVDLAGSERSSGSTERMKEGANINKSLTTLGRVISALTTGEKPPFRDSTLTWLLKESLGGNSKTTMIACLSPVEYEETLSTLRYSSLVKKIKLTAQMNVIQGDQQFILDHKLQELQALNDSQSVQLDNLARFYEERLVDQSNQYDLLNEKYLCLKELNLMDVQLDRFVNGVTGLHDKASARKTELIKDLDQFAPESFAI